MNVCYFQIASHCIEIVKNGGLKTLQRFYEEKVKEGKKSLIKVSQIIAKIIANLCVHESLHNDVVDSGVTFCRYRISYSL